MQTVDLKLEGKNVWYIKPCKLIRNLVYLNPTFHSPSQYYGVQNRKVWMCQLIRLWKHFECITIKFLNFIHKWIILVAKQQDLHVYCNFDQNLPLPIYSMQFTLNSRTWSVVYSTIFKHYNIFANFFSLKKTFLQKFTKISENWSPIILIKNPHRARIFDIVFFLTPLFSINVIH
jgi:hypothetical protein